MDGVLSSAMAGDFEIIQIAIDRDALKRLDRRRRKQLVGCMHAHNEISVLNRTLLFSQNPTGEGELHDVAHAVQMWCFLQVLVGKLYETWKMIHDRFVTAKPTDPALNNLNEVDRASLNWLLAYFGESGKAKSPLRIIRDKAGFHYDKLDLDRPFR